MNSRTCLWSVIGVILALILGAAAIWTWMTWESRAWRSAFAQVKPGTPAARVEARFTKLCPVRTHRGTGSFRGLGRHTGSYVFFRGPNSWQYVIQYDTRGRVAGKMRWWD